MSGKITDHLRGQSSFVVFEEGQLWYQTETGLQFGIPSNEIGEMTINATEVTTRLMRWVRRAWIDIEQQKSEQAEAAQPLATA